ncbi:MAG: SPOR domain-containing protein [Gammaproteobacteria bacterium]|nr:SPOR domain-containing protein [Gammaproteobacteria bacterium]
MTLMQQQRLIGAILLVCVFGGLAYFLMSSATQQGSPTDKVEYKAQEDDFIPSVDMISEGDIEVISNDVETLIDPHNLVAVEAALDKPEEVIITKTESKEKIRISPQLEPSQAVEKVTQIWFLQLASFSVEKNALALQNKVQSLGYDAKIQAGDGAKGRIYRVRIGPNSDKSTLQPASEILNKKLGLKSQIVQKIP